MGARDAATACKSYRPSWPVTSVLSDIPASSVQSLVGPTEVLGREHSVIPQLSDLTIEGSKLRLIINRQTDLRDGEHSSGSCSPIGSGHCDFTEIVNAATGGTGFDA